MKKSFWLVGILIIGFIVSGCSQLRPDELPAANYLSDKDWPTPKPPAPSVTPVTFSEVMLEDVTTPTPTAAMAGLADDIATPVAEDATETTVETSPTAATTEAEVEAVEASPGISAANLEPVAAGVVNTSALNVRQGPGPEYGTLTPLAQGNQVEILAQGQDQIWALIKTSNGQYGWVDLEFLTIDGAVANAPVAVSARPNSDLPADQIVPLLRIAESGLVATQVSDTPVVPAAVSQLSSSGAGTLPPINLVPVAEARIKQVGLNYVRKGPSTDYSEIDTLPDLQEKLDILALDQSGKWILVDPALDGRETGWVDRDQLRLVVGSLESAPRIHTAWVNNSGEPVRAGPGIFYDQVGILFVNTLIQVLGVNEAHSWVLIQPLQGGWQAWARLSNLTIHTPLEQLPVAPRPDLNPTDPTALVENPAPDNVIDQGKLLIQRSSGGEILLINTDGTGLHSITTGIDPALSPDAQTIAFTRWDHGQAGNGTVRLIDIDGSNERIVQEFIKQPKGPDWSPDGSRLVVNHQFGGQLEDKQVCRDFENGEAPTVPGNASDIKADITIRDDTKVRPQLCWTDPADPFWTLRVINLVDGISKDADGGTYAFRPAWDPSQPWRIVTDGGRGLLATDINRVEQQSDRLTENVNDGSPVFSWDGRYLAFSAQQQSSGQGHDIYRINSDGSGRVKLTHTPLWVSVLPDEKPQWNNVSPVWAPNRYEIAFLTDRTGRWEIWLMNGDGSDQRPMFADEVQDQLQITYNFVDERVLSWR